MPRGVFHPIFDEPIKLSIQYFPGSNRVHTQRYSGRTLITTDRPSEKASRRLTMAVNGHLKLPSNLQLIESKHGQRWQPERLENSSFQSEILVEGQSTMEVQ
jgi:hypothetical protein